MNFYFTLQIWRIVRWFRENGINPAIGFFLVLPLFIILSKVLFYRTEYGEWIYLLTASWAQNRLITAKTTFILEKNFDKKSYRLIQLCQHFLVASPFLLFMLLEQAYLAFTTLLLLSILLSFVDIKIPKNKIIPTPFRKLPFEYIIGFRKGWWLFLFLYFLMYKAVQVDNYNLGMVSMVLVFIVSMTFYIYLEPPYFVWIYKTTVHEFLLKKLIITWVCVTILNIPSITCLIFFFHNFHTTLLVYTLAYLLLGSILVLKYAAFPDEASIPMGILYVLSITFPPLLLFTLPYFFQKTKKRLKPILEC